MKQAASSIVARVFITLMGLFTTMAVGQRLGAAGLGDISLIVLGITVIMLVNNMVGGGVLVYFTPRIDRWRLLAPAYGWAIITLGIATILTWVVPIVPDEYRTAVLILAGLQCIYTIHLNLLLGEQRILVFNVISSAQAFALLVSFLLIQVEIPSARDYVLASLISFAATVLLSTVALFTGHHRRRRRSTAEDPAALIIPPDGSVLPVLLRQGLFIQGANTLQLLNYRLSYWLIDRFSGTAALGVYSVATSLAEGSWVAPRGLGTLLHSKVSNNSNTDRQQQLTLLALKASVVLAAAVIAIVLMLPDVFIRQLFGNEVRGLRPLIALLTPGMLAMAASQAFSHWFSGTARNRHNTIGSGIGLAVTLVSGFLSIPLWGLRGAAFTASLAYATNTIYQAWVFRSITGTRLRDLLPRANDAYQLLELVRRGFKR